MRTRKKFQEKSLKELKRMSQPNILKTSQCKKTLLDDQLESYRFLHNYAPSEVSADVLNRIKDQVVSRYSNNYSMQKTLILDQVEAYMFLRTYDPKVFPPDVLKKITTRMETRYSSNFSMQKTLVENEVESYLSLQK